jgi:hypothetical protein
MSCNCYMNLLGEGTEFVVTTKLFPVTIRFFVVLIRSLVVPIRFLW